MRNLIFNFYVTMSYWLHNPRAFPISIGRFLRERLYFPFWIYTTLIGLIFLPLYVQAYITKSDLTGTPIYMQTLIVANPFLDHFNDPQVFYPLYVIAFGLSFLYACKKLKGKRSKRVIAALSWSGLMITVGLFGILGASLGIINFLTHQEWEWGIRSIVVAVIISGMILTKSLPQWSEKAVAFS